MSLLSIKSPVTLSTKTNPVFQISEVLLRLVGPVIAFVSTSFPTKLTMFWFSFPARNPMVDRTITGSVTFPVPNCNSRESTFGSGAIVGFKIFSVYFTLTMLATVFSRSARDTYNALTAVFTGRLHPLNSLRKPKTRLRTKTGDTVFSGLVPLRAAFAFLYYHA